MRVERGLVFHPFSESSKKKKRVHILCVFCKETRQPVFVLQHLWSYLQFRRAKTTHAYLGLCKVINSYS